jgi:hypothetical protein
VTIGDRDGVTEIVRVDGNVSPERCHEFIIETIVEDHENLDEWMRVSQGSAVGWAPLRNRVKAATDPAAFLKRLADDTDRLMGGDEQRTVRHASVEEKIEYAPTWFAQFLAKRQVWAWPARYNARMAYMYPSRFSPLIARMSVPGVRREFADSVFRYHQDQNHTGAVVSLQAFATVALCGNAWEVGNSPFRWYPLAAFKERAPNPKRKHVRNGMLSPVDFERQQKM